MGRRMKRRSRNILLAVTGFLAVCAGLALLYWDEVSGGLPDQFVSITEEGGSGSSGDSRRPVVVSVANVTRGRAQVTFQTSGTVLAADTVDLTSEIAARVEEVFIRDSAILSQDDPILRFDDDAQKQSLQAAEAALTEAEAALSRARTLFRENVSAEARVETARARAQTARADLQAARNALDDRTVRAPFAGQVGFIDVSPGAVLRPGDMIARLETVDDLRVRFRLPTGIADRAGEIETVDLIADEAACRESEILTISPLVDRSTRARLFEARLSESCPLIPGAFVTVSVVIDERSDALFVPHEAVLREGFDTYVFRVEEAEEELVAHRLSIATGDFGDGRIEVLDGLGAGDRVVSNGLQKLRDGVAIAPAENDQAQEQASR